MKIKPTITYIKNGVEKTVKLNIFNELKIFSYPYSIIPDPSIYYEIKKDIEFIHIKNMEFNNISVLKIPEDSICILEDCTFKSESLKLTFENGTIELINPKFIGVEKIELTSLTKDLNIKYTKEINQEQKLKINADRFLSIAGEPTRTIDITDQSNIENITTSSRDVSLKNKFKLTELTLWGSNISLGNFKEGRSLIITEEFSPYIKAHKNLNLKDLVLINNGKGEMNIISPQINVENVKLTSKKSIQINENNYHKKTDDGYVVVTDEDFARTNLINTLKTIQVALQKQIKLEENKKIAEYNQSEYQDKLIEQRRIINEKKKELQKEETTLKKIKQEIADKRKEKANLINKSLSRKKVRYFTK